MRLPQVRLAVVDPPFREFFVHKALGVGDLNHRSRSRRAGVETKSGEHEFGLIGISRCSKGTRFDVGEGLVRVQTPGDPGEGVGPFIAAARIHEFVGGIINSSFFARGTEAEGFEIGTVFAIELSSDLREQWHALFCRSLAEHQSHFTADHGGRVFDHLLGEFDHIGTSSAESTNGNEALAWFLGAEPFHGDFLPFVTHLREQPYGASCDVRVFVFEQSRDSWNGFFAFSLEPGEAAVANVHCGALEREDLSLSGAEIDLWHHGFEAFWRDAINRAGSATIAGAVTADAWVEPVSYVECAIRTDGNVSGAEASVEFVVGTTDEVRAGEFFLGVGGEKINALQLKACTIGHGEVTEDDVFASLASEQQALPFVTEGTIFIVGDTSRRAAAIDITRGHGAGVFLTPFSGRSVLTGALVSIPRALAIGRGEAGIATFDDFGNAAGWWIVVIGLEHVAKRIHRLLVGVAVVVANDASVRAIGIHAHGKSSDPDVAVIAFLTSCGAGIRIPGAAAALVVAGADAEGFAGFVSENATAVSVVEIPLAIGTSGDGVQGVVVLTGIETSEQDFFFIDGGIVFAVAIDVGVNDEIGWLGNDHFVVEYGDTERRFKIGILREYIRGLGFAIAIAVADDHDAVAFWTFALGVAVVGALGNVETSVFVEVDVGGVVKLWRGSPDRDF